MYEFAYIKFKNSSNLGGEIDMHSKLEILYKLE